MSEDQKLVLEVTQSLEAITAHPGIATMDFSGYLTIDLPVIGDEVSYVIDGKRADFVVLKRRFVFEPGQTTAVIHLGLAN